MLQQQQSSLSLILFVLKARFDWIIGLHGDTSDEKKTNTGSPRYSRFCYLRFRLFTDQKTRENHK